jgi:hypothetical protein
MASAASATNAISTTPRISTGQAAPATMLSGIGCGRRRAGSFSPFPYTKRYAAELTSGTALDRFDFALNLILDGLGKRQLVLGRVALPGYRCVTPDSRRCRP